MLQYINWLWGGHKHTYNFDKLRRMLSVSKIETTYLRYKSRQRVTNKKNNDINLYIKNITNSSNQSENINNVTSKSNKNLRKRNKNKNKNNRMK